MPYISNPIWISSKPEFDKTPTAEANRSDSKGRHQRMMEGRKETQQTLIYLSDPSSHRIQTLLQL